MKPNKNRNNKMHRAINQIVSKQVCAPLSKQLRKNYTRRSIRIIADDTVKVIRGEYKGITGKVTKISTESNSVAIEGNKKEKYSLTCRLGTFTLLEIKIEYGRYRFMLLNLGFEL